MKELESDRKREEEKDRDRKKAESKIETSDYSFIHSLAGDQIKDTTARPGKTSGHATDTGGQTRFIKMSTGRTKGQLDLKLDKPLYMKPISKVTTDVDMLIDTQ